MKFIDWFAGIGGFRRGLELAGHKCVGFCEYDNYAVASYTAMHLITKEQAHYLKSLPLRQRQKEILKPEYRNGEWYAKDISEVKGSEIPKADIWTGGFPCQDISVAGCQKGFKGERSSLFFQFVRLLKEQEEENKPEWIILENVKNLLSVNDGWDFAKVLFALGKAGYNVGWQVFNSKDHGVPQNRERVYIIGHLRGRGRRKIFPFKGTGGENSVPVKIVGHRNGFRRNTQVFALDGVTEALSTCQGGGREHHVAVPIEVVGHARQVHNHGEDKERVLGVNGVSPTLRSTDYKEPCRIAIPVLTPDREKRQNGRRFKENGDPAFTLTAQDRHGVAIEVSGFNTMPDGSCRTLKNQYQKNSAANFVKQNSMGATAVAVKIKEATKKGYATAYVGDSINLSMPNSKTRRGRVGGAVAQTLDTSCNQGVLVTISENTPSDGMYVQLSEDCTVYATWYEKYNCYIAIRKLTPRECFRLQGWGDKYFNRASYFNSDSQLYKQAGNGVTVNVVQIIGELLNG